MGASTLMNIGARALAANYAALHTTGHNIANANVPGYSRQQAELTTSIGQYTGAGFFGRGVDVQTVVRDHDKFLTREAAAAKSLAELDAARLAALERLESVFKTGEQGLGHAAGAFLNAMVDFAARPQDPAARQVVLARAADAANRFAGAAAHIETLQAGIAEDLTHSIATVNELAAQIADVNQRIAGVQGSGQPPNDLLDLRDRLVNDLSSNLQVSTVAADDGTVSVFVAGGQRLVLANHATPLRLMSDPQDPGRVALGVVDGAGTRLLPSANLGGGSIAGLLRFQDEDLAQARNLVGQLATAFATRVNEQQAFGLDGRVPPGAGAPVFGLGAPVALAAQGNARDMSGNFIAGVSLSVVDASQVQASDYDLQRDPAVPGNYLLARLTDGLTRSIASGDTVDGVQITVAPAMAAGDRFRLKPVGQAASGMSLVLDDPRGLAAASPVAASLPLANTGTASVASLHVVDTSFNPALNAHVRFTSASGNYDWELRDRVTNALVSSGSATWTAGSPIALNGFELTLNGVPASGDRVDVVRTPQPASDNGNALALLALRDERLVGRTLDGLGNAVGGETVTDAWATAMGRIGVAVQGARTASEISAGVAAGAEAQRAGKSGVNLDEEAARLLQFQQSYQAAAKVLQVAQSVFDALLDAAG